MASLLIYAAALCVHLLQPGTGHQVLCANVIRRADVSISQMTLSSRTVEVERAFGRTTDVYYVPVCCSCSSHQPSGPPIIKPMELSYIHPVVAPRSVQPMYITQDKYQLVLHGVTRFQKTSLIALNTLMECGPSCGCLNSSMACDNTLLCRLYSFQHVIPSNK
jgi:hypothetical protein